MNLNCTWREMMREAAQRLGAAGIENPARDARLLLAQALGLEPVDVIAHEMDAVDPVQLTQFEQLVQRRLAGEPVSRIRGWREFYGRRFRISPDVLDPRPETELLVSEGLKRLPDPRTGNVRVLDLGTGSGCILLSVLAERRDAAGVGVDISAAALGIARENARALGVSDRVSFIEGGWNAAIGPLSGAFDLVLSNPPYVAEAELAGLAKDVRAYDPSIALTPGADALAAHRAILSLAPDLIKPGGWIGMEFGLGQSGAVASLMSDAGLAGIAIFPDLAGIPRAAFGRRE
jgi:release factor glutamine methyltransferase